MSRKAETLTTISQVCLLFSNAALGAAEAQQYAISTVAGEFPHPPPTPVREVDLILRYPLRVATDFTKFALHWCA